MMMYKVSHAVYSIKLKDERIKQNEAALRKIEQNKQAAAKAAKAAQVHEK